MQACSLAVSDSWLKSLLLEMGFHEFLCSSQPSSLPSSHIFQRRANQRSKGRLLGAKTEDKVLPQESKETLWTRNPSLLYNLLSLQQTTFAAEDKLYKLSGYVMGA